jgi:hypothetical protein
MKILLLSLLVIVARSAAADVAPSFAHLGHGERVRVRFHSQGCFHNYRYTFSLEGGDTLVARSSAGRAATLSRVQRTGLDQLLQFYRKRRPGLCTTQDEITLTYFRGEQRVSTEHYVDGTCATDDMKQVVRFDEVAKKLGITFP